MAKCEQFFFSAGEGIEHWHHFEIDGAQNKRFVGIVHEKSLANYTRNMSELTYDIWLLHIC